MADNYLERLIAEWHEYQGYVVRRNVKVGRRPGGGYESELDVIAFHAARRHLVHYEASMDAESWAERETRFRRKFSAGRKYCSAVFPGFQLAFAPDQVAVLVVASRRNRRQVGGGSLVLAKELLAQILNALNSKGITSHAVPEQYPCLRTLQFLSQYRDVAIEEWKGTAAGRLPRRT